MNKDTWPELNQRQLKRWLFSWFNARAPKSWHDEDIDRLVEKALVKLEELLVNELKGSQDE